VGSGICVGLEATRPGHLEGDWRTNRVVLPAKKQPVSAPEGPAFSVPSPGTPNGKATTRRGIPAHLSQVAGLRPPRWAANYRHRDPVRLEPPRREGAVVEDVVLSDRTFSPPSASILPSASCSNVSEDKYRSPPARLGGKKLRGGEKGRALVRPVGVRPQGSRSSAVGRRAVLPATSRNGSTGAGKRGRGENPWVRISGGKKSPRPRRHLCRTRVIVC